MPLLVRIPEPGYRPRRLDTIFQVVTGNQVMTEKYIQSLSVNLLIEPELLSSLCQLMWDWTWHYIKNIVFYVVHNTMHMYITNKACLLHKPWLNHDLKLSVWIWSNKTSNFSLCTVHNKSRTVHFSRTYSETGKWTSEEVVSVSKMSHPQTVSGRMSMLGGSAVF